MTGDVTPEPGPAVKDVLIIGGGIGGMSAAIAFGKRGIKTTVVERDGRWEGANIGFKYRGLQALQELGILDPVVANGRAYAVGQDSRFEAMFEASGKQIPMGPPPEPEADYPFPITSVRLLRPILWQIMQDAAREQGAELIFGHTYQSIEQQGEQVNVILTNGENRAYDLVVGADGIYSGLRALFLPDAGDVGYLGRMNFRVKLEGAPDHWRDGQFIAPDGLHRIITHHYPDGRYHFAVGKFMEHRHVEQDEARAIVREGLEPYRGSSEMFDEIIERVTDEVKVIVTPLEWIYVPPPWHRGRIVLIGDAVHASAPTIGSGGQMAIEDALVLAGLLAEATDVEQALVREARARMVVETSARLVSYDHEPRPNSEEISTRREAMQELVAPY
jgi:2-polyprenyl-6-methoxyphenol hydroxylase-like FAD-dependent oxidoreductase